MSRFFAISLVIAVALSCVARGQNPEFPGYIGVYVIEGNGGMEITQFIPDTPAAEFASTGQMRRGDIIARIGQFSTRTLQELRFARNKIPQGMEGKMVLIDRQGYRRHLWVSRNEEGGAAAAAPAASAPAAAGNRGAPDRFNSGGRGEGNQGEDYRRSPGVGSPPASGGASGDYRPRQ